MGIVNRRNAVAGWAVWKVVKQILKRKARKAGLVGRAKEAVPGVEVKKARFGRRKSEAVVDIGKKRRLRLRSKPDPVVEVTKRRRGRGVLAAIAALSVGIATFVRARGNRGPDSGGGNSAEN